MIDEAGVGAHRCVAGPTANVSGPVLSPVLVCCQRGIRELIAWQITHNVVVALVVSMEATFLAKETVLEVNTQLGLSSTVLAALGAGKCECTALVVLRKLGKAR